MVDPHKVTIVEGNSVTTPNVSWIQIRNFDILYDDVAGAADHPNAPSFDDASLARTNETLVACHCDPK